MKKQLLVAALCMLAVSGLQAAESGEPGQGSTLFDRFKKSINWDFGNKDFHYAFSAVGPFDFGMRDEKGKFRKIYSAQNQAIILKVIVIGWLAKEAVKRMKKSGKKKKHKKHHSHS